MRSIVGASARMRYRRFGSTDLTASEVGFGCARIGGVFQGSSRTEMVTLLRRAFDHGVTFFDTADMYTQGESERLVGDAFHHNRDRVVIATKFGYKAPARKLLLTRVKPFVKPLIARLGLKSQQVHAGLRGTVSRQDFSPAYIARAVEASLRRLKTDYIDVYQLHDPPVEVLEHGEFVEQLELLRQQGKVRYWGVACQRPEDALVCLKYPSLASIQVGLSALEQAALDAAIPRAAERGNAIIARQVFASGLLTRPLDALHLDDIDYDPQVAARKRDQLAVYASIAERCGRSRAEMALQFALARNEVSVVLLGISREEQVEPNLRALQATRLSAEEQQLITASRRPGR
jgi:aryl-alcohol dehydrogenase-like predicted oxidoreductase